MIMNSDLFRRLFGVSLLAGTLAFSSQPGMSANKPATLSALDLARSLNQAFADVAEQVIPSVVVIEVIQKPGTERNAYKSLLEKLEPEVRRQYEEYLENSPNYSRGSGIVIRKDGYILTNSHVVEEAESIKVQLRDGREFVSKKVWRDPQSDIAVVKIEAQDLPEAQFADSGKVRVGEFAIAIGAPYVLDYSVTVGHVSAKGRSHVIPSWAENSLGARMDQDFIQTDASINPGNSGGPLVDLEGRVIGINTVIRGIGTGIGFAVPSNLAKLVSDQLIAEGRFVRAWLGVQIEPLRDSRLRNVFKDIEKGVVISGIQTNGPAVKSKLRTFDVITSIDGTPVSSAQELRQAVRAKKVGSTLKMDVLRAEKKEITKHLIEVTTEAWPEEMEIAAREQVSPAPSRSPLDYGLTVQPLTKELAKKHKIAATKGVVVTEVKPNSRAAKAGIKIGDVVTEANDQPVSTPNDFREAINKDESGRTVLNIISRGVPRTSVLNQAD